MIKLNLKNKLNNKKNAMSIERKEEPWISDINNKTQKNERGRCMVGIVIEVMVREEAHKRSKSLE